MEFDEINRILEMVREHELSEFELERADFKLRVKSGSAAHVVAQPVFAAPVAAPQMAAPAAVAAPAEPAGEDLAIVTSPIVGTFFRSAEPGAAAFVDVGATVKKGDVLCIIEAMKLMNEIDSEYDGEVVKVYVENGQPVQYGERLFAIKPNV